MNGNFFNYKYSNIPLSKIFFRQSKTDAMLKIVIIEDEAFSTKLLVSELSNLSIPYKVVATLTSIRDCMNWFDSNTYYDLVLMDIHLPDGPTFSLFSQTSIKAPVIFITAYDNYYADAFKNNGIDYLLKPVSQTELIKAINKYERLKNFIFENNTIYEFLQPLQQKKNNVIVKRGDEYSNIHLNDVVYFFSESRIVYLVDVSYKKYMTEYANLIDIEKHLDENVFFKANRKFIVNMTHLKKFRRIDKSRYVLELAIPSLEPIIVSQGNTILFKKAIRSI